MERGKLNIMRGVLRGASLGALGLALFGAPRALIYSANAVAVPGSARIFTAFATMRDAPPAPIFIVHTPLRGISPIDKVAIVQGAAGFHPTNNSVPFPDRITSLSRPLAAGDEIQIHLFYKVVLSSQEAISDTIPFQEVLPPIVRSTDPLPFAFQISPEMLTGGTLEYRIFAYRFQNGVAVSTAAYPPEAVSNLNAAVVVGVSAGASPMFDLAAGGRIELFQGNPNVGNSYLDIPAGLLAPGTEISFNQLPLSNSIPYCPISGLSNPVSVYALGPPKVNFNGNLLVSVSYPDFIYPKGQDGIIDGTSFPETSAGLAYYDGFSWRKLGGRVDPNLNTVTALVGEFRCIAVVPMGALSPEERRPPQRIITPNGDLSNQAAVFDFGGSFEEVEVNIFDITGHRVCSLRGVGQQSWYGRDDSGKIVESGVYIYQYKLDGKRVSGVIAVAK